MRHPRLRSIEVQGWMEYSQVFTALVMTSQWMGFPSLSSTSYTVHHMFTLFETTV
ncbi:MAG: hypothetical protein GY812_02330 [Actinomycetia bacterium]|nr:hypothetical protein [Actinomycetes bacterium]